MRASIIPRVLSHTRRGLVAVSAAGVVAAGLTAWWAGSSPTFVDPAGLAVWRSLIIAVYWAAGVVTWWRRPESRLGRVILLLTLLYVGQAAVGSPVALVYTLGMVVWAASIAYTAYVFLCFPTGDLESAIDRWFVRSYWLTTAAVWGLILAVAPTLPPGGSFVSCGTSCPPNALQIVDGHANLATALTTTFHVQFAIALIGLAVLVVSKARSSSAIRRRAMIPLAVAMLADIAQFVIALFVLPSYPQAAGVLKLADGVVTVAVPAAILLGQIIADRLAATSSSQIALGTAGTPMNHPGLETMIRDTLGDPTLRVALWDDGRRGYVDVHGIPTSLPDSDATRRVTAVTHDGHPLAALIYDAAIDADSHLIAGLTATALTLLHNTRLVHELRASRARIVSAAERERSRMEAELHDGAVQRLVAVHAYLGLARQLTERADVQRQIDNAVAQADLALSGLRALSLEIHPAALRDYGLAVALRDLGLLSPLEVRLTDNGIGRYSREVEAGLYFFVREAIHNASQHAGTRVTLTLTEHDDDLRVTVREDGVGIRRQGGDAGPGLTGMRDQIESLGGELRVDSAPHGGTSLHATIPVGSSATPLGEASTHDDADTAAAS